MSTEDDFALESAAPPDSLMGASLRHDSFEEIRLDAREEYLYVAETMRNHIIRFRVQPDGSLTDKEIVGPASLGVGAAVDGFAFDQDGNVWVTTVLRNGVGIITPDGDYHVVFEEANEPLLSTFEDKIAAGEGTPADMAATASADAATGDQRLLWRPGPANRLCWLGFR